MLPRQWFGYSYPHYKLLLFFKLTDQEEIIQYFLRAICIIILTFQFIWAFLHFDFNHQDKISKVIVFLSGHQTWPGLFGRQGGQWRQQNFCHRIIHNPIYRIIRFKLFRFIRNNSCFFRWGFDFNQEAETWTGAETERRGMLTSFLTFIQQYLIIKF